MFIFIGMISFNNLCLKYVEVSFYQVLTPVPLVPHRPDAPIAGRSVVDHLHEHRTHVLCAQHVDLLAGGAGTALVR